MKLGFFNNVWELSATHENAKTKVIWSIINVVPFELLKRSCAGSTLVVYYHLVSDGAVPHIKNLYRYKGRNEFQKDIDFLMKNYTPISLSDLILSTKGEKELPPRTFLLTFDDGLREIYEVAFPILLGKNLKATVFLSSGFLDNTELCYEHKASLLIEKLCSEKGYLICEKAQEFLKQNGIDYGSLDKGILGVGYSRRNLLEELGKILGVDFDEYLHNRKPYLTSDQITSLMKYGWTIGAHSIDHPYFSGLTLEDQMRQTLLSVKVIREKFGLSYGAFAFPHNDEGVPAEYFEKIEKSGIVDVTFGTGGVDSGMIGFHRQRMSLERPPLPARNLVAWQYARRIYRNFMKAEKADHILRRT